MKADVRSTPCESHFCRHVAAVLPPPQLRALLVSAAPNDEPSSPTTAAWDRFVEDLVGRSERHRLSRPAGGYEEALRRLLADPAVRDHAKALLRIAAAQDPADALQDAEVLVWLMRERLEDALRRPVRAGMGGPG